MADLSVSLGSLRLKNPVLTASGTFGYGEEFSDFVDLERLGGFIVKGTTLNPRQGNPYPRMAETASGMLNCVGLQNRGVRYLIDEIYPRLKDLDTNVIVNLSGSCVEDYQQAAALLSTLERVPAIELNISCPNVRQGGMTFGVDPEAAYRVVSAVREAYSRHLMVKLTPNVTDVREIALACQEAGADSVSLINTLLGMAIDARTRRPRLSTVTGGLSGPAIKPVALRMVWQVAKVLRIPVVGIGGIETAEDAVEFLLAGASAVEIGTANFVDPSVTVKVVDGIASYLDRQGLASVSELIGGLIE